MDFRKFKIENLIVPTDPIGLGVFRILFGILLYVQSLVIFNPVYVRLYYLDVPLHFTFGIFDVLHIPIFSDHIIKIIFFCMGVCSSAIAMGFLTRLALIIYTACFTYIFLLEKLLYNNHYYLMILFLLILCFSGCWKWASVDNILWKKQKSKTISFWPVFLLRMQVVIVFFYGAVAKMNVDWLIFAEPMHIWLSKMFPLFGVYFKEAWVAYVFSWGGMLFDLFLSIFLLTGRYKGLTFLGLIIFNVLNHLIFNTQIGIFPFLMIASYVLFLEPRTIRRFLHRFFKNIELEFDPGYVFPPSEFKRKIIYASVFLYLIIQMVLPLRHWLYPGYVSWNTVGERFSWRMKLNFKDYHAWLVVVDKDSDASFVDNFPRRLYYARPKVMTEPDMLMQYVAFLKKELFKQGVKNPLIYIYSYVGLNGRDKQLMFRSDVNLAETKFSLKEYPKWIMPLENKFSLINNFNYTDRGK